MARIARLFVPVVWLVVIATITVSSSAGGRSVEVTCSDMNHDGDMSNTTCSEQATACEDIQEAWALMDPAYGSQCAICLDYCRDADPPEDLGWKICNYGPVANCVE